ncbi:MAG: family 43 glycosylhydrolase [Carboxylicivirga sp.]|jgi:hypothetical protein|nr:family 43 glycosylhydrolase [Carboxylicivirga sp.]
MKILIQLYLLFNTTVLFSQKVALIYNNPDNLNWSSVLQEGFLEQKGIPVEFKVTNLFLSSPGVMRRDPIDIIKVNGEYYMWYTKVSKDHKGYPEGWAGTIWYAKSKDGKHWQEQGQALDKGSTDDWDGTGVYTPNILHYKGKYYLAYTAMPYPFVRKHSQAQIGMAVADSPDGPWLKYITNPVLSPGVGLNSPDGFLVDDAAFLVEEQKVYLYYKGFARHEKEGKPIRGGKNTFLMRAEALTPDGPFVKHPVPLHRGHEAVVWLEKDGVGSFGTGWSKYKYYKSDEYFNFNGVRPLNLMVEPKFKIRAIGVYRPDLNGEQLSRPSWGICMAPNKGLARFEIIWNN